jgi:hypothetical protein
VWLVPLHSESLPPVVGLEPGKFIVVTVEEGADVRHPGGDWEQLRPGDVIGEGDEFGSGDGRVIFSDHNGNLVSLEPMTTAKITEAKVGVVDHVDVHLEYGTLEITVKKSGLKADLKISAPNAMTGIRGSLVRMTHDDVSRRSTVLVAEGAATIDTRRVSLTVHGPGDFEHAVKTVIGRNGKILEQGVVPIRPKEWTLLPGFLVLEMTVRAHIPVRGSAIPGALVSWHFVVDLDGRQETGLRGDQPPVSVFPSLGVDLWVERGYRAGVGFYKRLLLFQTTGEVIELPADLLQVVFPRVRLDQTAERHVQDTLQLRVRLADLQDLAARLAGIAIDPLGLKWVAVTNYFERLEDDPPSDFFPNDLYVTQGVP